MSRIEMTKKLIMEHCGKYPALEIQDLLKFLHQSSFGCEHLVTDLVAATEYIKRETENYKASNKDKVEALDGDFCRVHLDVTNEGLRAETLGKLFYLSAHAVKNGKEELENRLNIVLELARKNKIKFSEEELRKEIAKWREKGYPACRHSEKFRELYAPGYRVIRNEYAFYLPLFAKIDSMLALKNVVFAIDGGCGSGKTTLANLLREVYDCNVFRMDDFFLQPHQRTKERMDEAGGNVDRERFLEEVLLPLKNEDYVRYRRYDCSSQKILKEVIMESKRLNVIEGSYSMHPSLTEQYDFCVFLDIDSKLQKERIEKRNSTEFAERFFKIWIPMENKYHSALQVKESSDLIFKIQ